MIRTLWVLALFLTTQAVHASCVNSNSGIEVVREVAAMEFQEVHSRDWLKIAHLRCPFTELSQVEDFIRNLCLDCDASLSRAHRYRGHITHSKLKALSGSVTERTLELAIQSLGGKDWQIVDYDLLSDPNEMGVTFFSLKTHQLIRLWTNTRHLP